MTLLLHREDPYLLEFEAMVRSRSELDGRPTVVLDRTAFYAECGGQPWDIGFLDDVPVVAVVERDGEVHHALERPLPVDQVKGRVDGERRRDHREQHHGQHLLTRAFEETASARTVAFHLGARETTIDLHREVTAEEVRAAAVRANEVAWQALPVRVRTVAAAEAAALGLKIPDGAGDSIRLVEIEGFDIQPCSGTHPRSTAEAGVIIVVGAERYKGGTRARFVCGHRALDAVARRLTVLDGLGVILSAPLDGLVAAAAHLQETLGQSGSRERELMERALDAEAKRLRGSTNDSPAVVVATYEGWAPAELRMLGMRLTALGDCVALLGSRAEKAHLVFAQSEGLRLDIPRLLAEAVASLGGRGGGRGNLAQGGGDRLDMLEEVLAMAEASVRTALRS